MSVFEDILSSTYSLFKARKRKHQPHRRNKFTRKPFDIDDLLGFGAFKSFDQVCPFV